MAAELVVPIVAVMKKGIRPSLMSFSITERTDDPLRQNSSSLGIALNLQLIIIDAFSVDE